MNFNSVIAGFVSGAVCGAILLIGSWAFFIRKIPGLLKTEIVKDLSHYGRDPRSRFIK